MLELKNITFQFAGAPRPLLKDYNLRIETGDLAGLRGVSGVGKSTLCNIIAGHVKPDSGQVLLDGTEITARPSRKVVLIHQEDDLFPWLRCLKQVMIAQSRPDRAKAQSLLEFVRIGEAAQLFPNQLSGGMKKRLALARALAAEPSLLLLDETFSSLDPQLRYELFVELKRIWVDTKTTILMVSHSQEDLRAVAAKVHELV